MSKSLLTPDGLLNVPGPKYASERSENMKTESANEDELLGQSDEDEIPSYQPPVTAQNPAAQKPYNIGRGPGLEWTMISKQTLKGLEREQSKKSLRH